MEHLLDQVPNSKYAKSLKLVQFIGLTLQHIQITEKGMC